MIRKALYRNGININIKYKLNIKLVVVVNIELTKIPALVLIYGLKNCKYWKDSLQFCIKGLYTLVLEKKRHFYDFFLGKQHNFFLKLKVYLFCLSAYLKYTKQKKTFVCTFTLWVNEGFCEINFFFKWWSFF